MPIIKPQGLQGLKGLGSLSKQDYDAFVERNKDLIASHNYDPVYINNLYSNKQFIDKFGVEKFKAIPDISVRNNLYEGAIVDEEWNKLYNPINLDGTRDNTKGLGSDWEKYSQMSTSAKRKVLESDYLMPSEFEERWQKDIAESKKNAGYNDSGVNAFVPGTAFTPVQPATVGYNMESGAGETLKQVRRAHNQNIIDHIYNDDADETAKRLNTEVSQVYQDTALAGLSDEQVKQAFVKAITPTKANMGISTYAAYYGDGSNVESEMKDFSIEDMREVLAKKAVYDQYMSPEMASTALNNDAKRYIKEHQGSMTRLGLWAKDVGISALSYTADKVNGIYNTGLMIADATSDKPVVWIDDTGNVVDPNTIVTEQGGKYVFGQGTDGKLHPVHQEQIARTTLHNMGKNFDGSDAESGVFHLNPQYWTRAEQFGTLSEAEQKQYEKLGVSPYKVAYDPNEETDLWYESFKMMSFGLADGVSLLIPYGIGQVGKVLSTAGKIGKIGRGLGSAMNFAGRAIGAESRFGQVTQGLAGAGGIAYAYQRGSFQETLAQNLANAEEAVLSKSRNEIFNQYNSDEVFKDQVDAAIDAKAASMKADYLKQMAKDGGAKLADEDALDEMMHARAQEQVLGEMVQIRVNEMKGSQEYADLQQEAINSAGETAVTTFLPEAIKYGLVNTIGFRSWLYSNPAKLQQQAGKVFQGIREMTTGAGKQRLTAKASEFATRGDKVKKFGKILGSQVWGGAWTNGSDDMMVDAAERINEDSFNQYLNAYAKGEALADTYGLADGLYSYWKGLNNSLGQETTWNAAAVGGLGSVVSVTPNMANIAHVVATKEGRQAYKDRYMQRNQYETNADGFKQLQRDEQGNPLTEKVSWRKNWRDRLNYFVQNGILNTYYGAKINEQDMQNHADYVNNILDSYKDFKVIEDLIASDIGLQNAVSAGDQKTMQFVKAIHAMDALNHLGNSKNDPAAMSSVVQNAKNLIERAAQVNQDNIGDLFSEEEASNLVAQYYANNPGMAQSDYNNWLAIHDIAKNAQKLQEAAKAYDEAETKIQSVERSRGKQIDPDVRAKMKMNQALDGHWEQRVASMKSEIGDMSTAGEISEEMIIPSLGGRKNAEALVKVYDKQQDELNKEYEEQKQETQKKQEALSKAQEELSLAQTSDEKYVAQQAVEKAQAELEDAHQQEEYLLDLGQRTTDKRTKVQQALNNQVQSENGKYQERVLTADEIFNLDSVTRARMMSPQNRQLYTKQQQREIENLEQRLLMKDGDALQKIQDIALLSQRIETNRDAYSRMAKNPEAAAVQLEAQRQQTADAGYKLINQRNAETVADVVNQFDEGMKGHEDVTQEQKDEFVFKTLRKLNPTLLNIIQEDQLLPQYQKQVQDAKEWGDITSDIDAVIQQSDKDAAWKSSMGRNIDSVISNANNKESVMASLENVIDNTNDAQIEADFEEILKGLENLGYQRDATVLENRKQRKERETADKEAKEAAKTKAEEDAQVAAAKAQAEEEAWINAQPGHQVKSDGSNLVTALEVAPIDQAEETAEQKGELSEPVDFSKPIVTKPTYHSSMKEQIGDKQFKWDYYTENDKNTRDTKEGKLILGTAMQNTLHPAINYAVDAGVLGEEHRLSDSNVTIENSNKAREAVEALQELGIESPSQLIEYVENNEGKNVPQNKVADSSVNNSMGSNLIETDDTVQGQSASIDDQMQENQGRAKEQHSSEETTDFEANNGIGEHIIETSATSLGGNAMAEYKPEPLKNQGKLEHKQGKEADDSMNKYYAWMDAAGVKLQNIIDQELGQIIRRNPQVKVKFMAIRPQDNATHDGDMKRTLMLVLDYDNSINKGITQIHNSENGGVFESKGRQYLMIGVAGYGNRNADKLALYDILFSNNPRTGDGYGLVRRGMGEFFRNNPEERFYVPEGLSTEVVPASLIPGYIVKQLETDEFDQFRSITDLLKDDSRNPMHLDMESLAWGIQERTKFLVVGTSLDRVMIPRDPNGNAGSAFVLIPAANGKLVPSYLKPLMWNEIRDGQLKDKINNLLMELTAPQYATRVQALQNLMNIFHFNATDGNDVLVGKDTGKYRNQISLVHDGKVFRTFTLDSNFDRQQFMEAMAEMNPRINITASVLQSPRLLQQYDEAGALQTDVARLATAGSSYSIYGVDANGNMIKPDQADNDIPKSPVGDFRNENRSQVVFQGNYYQYNTTEGVYYLNGKAVTDARVIRDLDYNRRVIEGALSSVETDGIWNTYILGTAENSEVIKINRNTYEVKVLPENSAKMVIERIAKVQAEKEREIAAEQELKAEAKRVNQEVKDAIDRGDATITTIDPLTGEIIIEEARVAEQQQAVSEKKEKKEEEGSPAEKQNQNQDSFTHRSVESLERGNTAAATQTFETMLGNRKYMMPILNIIKKKWSNAPMKVTDLKQFLKGKNMEVDAIGTSESDVQAWIKTLEDCR